MRLFLFPESGCLGGKSEELSPRRRSSAEDKGCAAGCCMCTAVMNQSEDIEERRICTVLKKKPFLEFNVYENLG